MNYLKNINTIILVDDAENYQLAEKIIRESGIKNIITLSNAEYESYLKNIPIAKAKDILALKIFPGTFARECPGTSSPYLCCRYEILSPAVNCTIGCTYCILQCYLNEPVNIIYVNIEKIIDDALYRYEKFSERLIRVGTGELSDSLVFELWCGIGEMLVKKFAEKKNIIFELKSKTTEIEPFLKFPAPSNIVLSWSLNPDEIFKSEEGIAASPSERIAAAKIATNHGYKVGFHFDPIIDWKNGKILYGELINKILDEIPPEKIAWISLGCLRYPSEMLSFVREHQQQSKIFSSEMIRAKDKKWRYPRPRRKELYSWVAEPILKREPDIFTYLCMEMPEVWEAVLGWAPENNVDFDKKFAESLKRRFY